MPTKEQHKSICIWI